MLAQLHHVAVHVRETHLKRGLVRLGLDQVRRLVLLLRFLAFAAFVGDDYFGLINRLASGRKVSTSTVMTRRERIDRLISLIPSLTEHRLEVVDTIVSVFLLPKVFDRFAKSELISQTILEDFGDVLRMHHCFSREPFSKDKFEYALERILQNSGVDAKLGPRGQRGYDIQIKNKNYSLKTEAAKAIKNDSIHISKFMELGGGQWGDSSSDLKGLRDQFLNALNKFDKILILRALRKGEPDYKYELVEIPKTLLLRAENGRLEMSMDSKQFPKPGYCFIEEGNNIVYSLYFDGGGERKLQIKGIPKNLCTTHATWKFEVLPIISH